MGTMQITAYVAPTSSNEWTTLGLVAIVMTLIVVVGASTMALDVVLIVASMGWHVQYKQIA